SRTWPRFHPARFQDALPGAFRRHLLRQLAQRGAHHAQLLDAPAAVLAAFDVLPHFTIHEVAVMNRDQLPGIGVHAFTSLDSFITISRRRACERASCDLLKLAVLPNIAPISWCV